MRFNTIWAVAALAVVAMGCSRNRASAPVYTHILTEGQEIEISAEEVPAHVRRAAEDAIEVEGTGAGPGGAKKR